MNQEYSFANITALIAEDNEHSRSLLGSALRNAGVGKIVAKSDGRDAIGFLEKVHDQVDSELYPPIEAVFANWDMGPIDGMLLLKWIRRHQQSPNRFMPFVLLTPEITKVKVDEAINAGAHEIIPKPFPREAVNRALENLIERHRLFVRTSLYFGPDRRRKRIDFSKMERREISEEGGEGGEEAWDQAAPDVHFYRIPNIILEKAQSKSGKSNLVIDEKIEEDLENSAEDYSDWIKTRINGMNFSLNEARDDIAVVGQSFQDINNTAEELRAQAATFGYPLLSNMAKSLSVVTNTAVSVSEKRLDLIKTHIDALDMVVKLRLRGDGGDQGKMIVRSLGDATRKILKA
jgi:CheY-like chemotaxis protein